jgi:predicted PurR-regulated permease PerM
MPSEQLPSAKGRSVFKRDTFHPPTPIVALQRPLQIGEKQDRFTWFLRLATFALVVAILRFAEDVLIPVALAALLAFLLTPMVVRLGRWGLPRAIAIIMTVTVAFSVIGAIGWLVTVQAISLVRELPNYEENLRQKIVAIKNCDRSEAHTRRSEIRGS